MDADQVAQLIATFSYPAVFLLLVSSGIGAPVSEELILIAGGIAVAKGGGNLPLMFACAVLGTMCGDYILYSIGRKLGGKATTHPKFSKILTRERVAKVETYFDKYGPLTIFLAGFMAGVRAPTFLIAGMTQYPKRRFLLADLACVAIFSPAMVYLGYRFGMAVLENIQGALKWLPLGVLALIAIVVVKKLVQRRRKADVLPGA